MAISLYCHIAVSLYTRLLRLRLSVSTCLETSSYSEIESEQTNSLQCPNFSCATFFDLSQGNAFSFVGMLCMLEAGGCISFNHNFIDNPILYVSGCLYHEACKRGISSSVLDRWDVVHMSIIRIAVLAFWSLTSFPIGNPREISIKPLTCMYHVDIAQALIKEGKFLQRGRERQSTMNVNANPPPNQPNPPSAQKMTTAAPRPKVELDKKSITCIMSYIALRMTFTSVPSL